MRRLFIYGYPGLYGGAGTELHHQIKIWKEIPDLELHIIPTAASFTHEPLYPEMKSLEITHHEAHDFSQITPDDAIINFCGEDFLNRIDEIYERTKKTIFVNCMTWIFQDRNKKSNELTAHRDNKISFSLYQRDEVRDAHRALLKHAGSKAEFLHFCPYFDSSGWEFSVKNQEETHIGHISRADADKFSKHTLHIYEYITSPKWKVAHFLGFGPQSEKKIGKPYGWIKTYASHRVFPTKDFYKTVDFIIQPTDTNENWPRIGFEAMFTGVPLVVDNRGGWRTMIEHRKTGFLCDTPKDFIYWGTRLSYEPELVKEIAHNALKKAEQLGGKEKSKASWEEVFSKVWR